MDINVRDPSYLFKTIKLLDKNYAFHFIINNVNAEIIKMRDAILGSQDNIYWFYKLPLNESLGIIHHADLLINIGNKTVNQTPSKIFDYISTGKPIVNFHSLLDDTSKFYLTDYPNKLNVHEDYERFDSNVKLVDAFAKKNAGSTIPVEQLSQLYSQYQSDSVSEETVEIIRSHLR